MTRQTLPAADSTESRHEPLSVCGFSEFCRGFSLNFVAARADYAASASGEVTSTL